MAYDGYLQYIAGWLDARVKYRKTFPGFYRWYG